MYGVVCRGDVDRNKTERKCCVVISRQSPMVYLGDDGRGKFLYTTYLNSNYPSPVQDGSIST